MNIGGRTDLTHEFYFILKKVKVQKGKNKLPGVTSKLILESRLEFRSIAPPLPTHFYKGNFSYVLPM